MEIEKYPLRRLDAVPFFWSRMKMEMHLGGYWLGAAFCFWVQNGNGSRKHLITLTVGCNTPFFGPEWKWKCDSLVRCQNLFLAQKCKWKLKNIKFDGWMPYSFFGPKWKWKRILVVRYRTVFLAQKWKWKWKKMILAVGCRTLFLSKMEMETLFLGSKWKWKLKTTHCDSGMS